MMVCTEVHKFKKGIFEMVKKSKTIGEKLRELRGTKTKNEIADAVGISFSSYVKYEVNVYK